MPYDRNHSHIYNNTYTQSYTSVRVQTTGQASLQPHCTFVDVVNSFGWRPATAAAAGATEGGAPSRLCSVVIGYVEISPSDLRLAAWSCVHNGPS